MAINSNDASRRTTAGEKNREDGLGASPTSPDPIDTAVDKFFLHDDRVRAAMSRNLRERATTTMEAAARAKAAFKNFSPSKYSPQDRARRNFVNNEVSSTDATRAAVEKGVEAIRASGPLRAMKIRLGSGFDNLVQKSSDGTSSDKVPLGELMAYIQKRTGSGTLHAAATASFTECRAEAEAQRRLDQILGQVKEDSPASIPPVAGTATEPEQLEAVKFVSGQVRNQMETASSPEGELRFAVPSRSSASQTGKAIETLELRSGPADVTSYHDFNNLQIAFEHVWQEIFDGRLAKLGQDLYHEYVRLQEFVGKSPDDKSVDTLDDLRNLMDEIRELARLTNNATPVQLQHKDDAGGASGAGDTADVVAGVVSAVLDPVGAVAGAIGNETVAAIIDPLGGIIKAIAGLIIGYPKLTWASLPGREPGGNGDMITVTVEPNAVKPGEVEIQLSAGQGVGWKGMNFIRLDEQLRPMSPMGIVTANKDDPMVWNRDSYNRLPLYTSEVDRAYLQFWHESGLIHTVCFVMDGLTEKLKDGTRVTFTFTKR